MCYTKVGDRMKKIRTESIKKGCEDFIDDPAFDRIDRTALVQVFYYSIIFFACSLLINIGVYQYFDNSVFKGLLDIKISDSLFFLAILYHSVKSLLINNVFSIVALYYSFRNYTLYEGEESKFSLYMLISCIIYSCFIGLLYFSFTLKISTFVVIMVVNLVTLLINLPSILYDTKRLFIY